MVPFSIFGPMTWMVVGLGNPGKQYEKTRHNLGFMALDRLSDGSPFKEQYKALVQKIVFAGQLVILAKPQTFMNLSGDSVQPLLSWYKIPPEKLIVLVDDVALDCGKLRIRPQGSHGGQNGLRSIIGRIGEQFVRLRIGAGKCPPGWDLADWVLSKLTSEDDLLCQQALAKVPDAVRCLIEKGIDEAMSRTNG